MRFPGTVSAVVGWIVLFTPLAQAGLTLNGWDTSHVFVIRNNLFQDGIPQVPPNSIELVTESALIPPGVRTRFGNILVADDFELKTLAFSNSAIPGVHSPAGARLFLAEGYPTGAATDIFIREYNASAQLLRRSYLGSAFGSGNGQLVSTAQPNNHVTVGCVRYNPRKRTLAVSATVTFNNGATVRARAYEFALPDWPADNGAAALAVTPVQVYEAPAGHTINGDHAAHIDFDNDGYLYMSGKSLDANNQGGGFESDLIRVSTLGHTGGTATHVISITGANAPNLLIEGSIENQSPDYDTVQALAVRTVNNSIMILTRTQEVAGEPTLEYSLTSRIGNGNLLFLQNWGPHASGLGINSNVTAGQRDDESGAVFVSCFRGEPGGGPKRINADGTINVIGWRNWDVASPPPIPSVTASSDTDNDGDVDLTDFAFLQRCFSTPPATASFECKAVDLVPDNSIDVQDLNAFLACLNGPNRPPACAN